MIRINLTNIRRAVYRLVKGTKRVTITLALTLFFALEPLDSGSHEVNSNIGETFVTEECNEEEFKLIEREEVFKVERDLLTAIDSYINANSKGSGLDPRKILEMSVEYDYDIVLALAQAQVESHFGTKGVASRTNSVWNVGTFDDGTILYKYEDPNLSIEPYMSLMVRRYLVNGKTANDLLKSWSFVNHRGKRYATFPYYEYRVRKVYEHIKECTNIDDIYEKYREEEFLVSLNYHRNTDFMYDLVKAMEFREFNFNDYYVSAMD